MRIGWIVRIGSIGRTGNILGELVALEGLVKMVDTVSGIGSIWRIVNIGDVKNMVELAKLK